MGRIVGRHAGLASAKWVADVLGASGLAGLPVEFTSETKDGKTVGWFELYEDTDEAEAAWMSAMFNEGLLTPREKEYGHC